MNNQWLSRWLASVTSLGVALSAADIAAVDADGLVEIGERSGEAAVTVLQGGLRPDLVITDFHMGAMNGIDLVREVRKMANLRFIPVLMVTTESQQAKRMEAKAAGATGWLVKPVQPEALLQVIKQVVPGA